MSWRAGDFNGDGRVDLNDLTILLSHFGDSVASAGPVGAVPEPATFVLLAVALLGLLAVARSRFGGGRRRRLSR